MLIFFYQEIEETKTGASIRGHGEKNKIGPNVNGVNIGSEQNAKNSSAAAQPLVGRRDSTVHGTDR